MKDKLDAKVLDEPSNSRFIREFEPLAEKMTDAAEATENVAIILMADINQPDNIAVSSVVWGGEKSDCARMIAAAMDAYPELNEIITEAVNLNFTAGAQ